jgi:hypothetical protein
MGPYRLQVKLDKEAKEKMNDPNLCCQLDSHKQPQHEDSTQIATQML